ncbi:MAG TPA: rhomboid family intramembrane serine protease [Stellaceae bacterium]|nr:rhomboid family intramembrane serine protease [Stellaceae bacterium]
MFFFLPLYDDNPIERPPLVTYLLIGLCIGAFLWQLGQDEVFVAYAYGMVPAELFGHWRPRGFPLVPPWATLFTSMFLHGGWLHLAGNMLFLWIFGNNVEDVLGRIRYIVLYLGCGVVAALSQALVDTESHLPMIGASGAIAGVLGAYLLLYPRANVHCFLWIIIFVRIVTVPAWAMLGFWFGLQFLSGLLSEAHLGGVAFWAHVGGFVAGIVLVTILRPRGTDLLQPPRTRVFESTPPGQFGGRRTFHQGSVPQSGRPFRRPPGPWG